MTLAGAATPSPNIWNDPDVYEVENHGVDPEGLIEAAMAGILERVRVSWFDGGRSGTDGASEGGNCVMLSKQPGSNL